MEKTGKSDNVDAINAQIGSMISTFPVPNTKEDIIEFLSMATPNAKKKGRFSGKFKPRFK